MKAVLFDLDGTLLPMDMEIFLREYLQKLGVKAAAYGYDPAKMVEVVMAGVEAMIQNDGSMTNEERFWQLFLSRIGGEKEAHYKLFEEFYTNEFRTLARIVQPTPLAREAVRILGDKGYTTVLATNPLFPSMAILERMSWAGLHPHDFALITTFENSRFTKPHLGYFQGILEAIGAAPQDCLMVGNDLVEDLPAVELGMEFFLVTDDLINPQGADYSQFPHGTREDLVSYLAKLPDRK
ncbi:HAD family hydrolase [Candidatus Darwinibacter acetoxidans]